MEENNGQDVDLFGDPVVKDVLLRDKFLEPPFSVLDTKGGNWQNRKRQWKQLGIQSELGRDAECLPSSFGGDLDENGLDKYGRKPMTGTSVFDPALCELMYRWFCPEGGTILDPFAGGSVRGIVANYLGFKYTGIDIRPEQIESNRQQAQAIIPDRMPNWMVGDSNVVLDGLAFPNRTPVTPIEKYGDVWVKREDLYLVCGASGAKARGAYHLVTTAKDNGFTTITTAGSRKSPQINIIAKICHALGLEFVAHTPEGELGADLKEAQELGATIIQHKAGYNSVIIARAREWAIENKAFEVPFGMMCREAVEQTMEQVVDLPEGIKRIVVPVGSGVNLAGVLWGMKETGINLPVLGVVVGADPIKTLNEFAPLGWESMVTLVKSKHDYHHEITENVWNGITLDPIYEAKCLEYLQDGDLFWVVGLRSSLGTNTEQNAYSVVSGVKLKPSYDIIFSCPPYADLEVYSDLKGDISNKPYDEFLKLYRDIITKSVRLLKGGGYAIFVVGDIRDKRGYYRDFVSHTKKAFIDAGAGLYNEAILLQPLGTAMLRCAKIFEAGGKLTKVHENILIFKKP